MIVVLDTNLWIKELALNSGIGSALRFFLKRQKARLRYRRSFVSRFTTISAS